jgi:hypothetical protein
MEMLGLESLEELEIALIHWKELLQMVVNWTLKISLVKLVFVTRI